jgi:hypothetical protein
MNKTERWHVSPHEIVVAISDDPEKFALSTPSIIACFGRLLLSYDIYAIDRTAPVDARFRIATSDDGGATWQVRFEGHGKHGRLFVAGTALFYIGHNGDLIIAKSLDRGDTWSKPKYLTSGIQWHQSASNVLYRDNRIYLVMERVCRTCGDVWPVTWFAPILLRASVNADLLDPSAWSYSTPLSFSDIIPGFQQNAPEIDYFGVPFHQQEYPISHHIFGGRKMHPMGWLEANVVQITDPRHYWHDPDCRTLHLLMRGHTGGVGYAALAKVVEGVNGSMTTVLEKAPSGKRILFLPVPGGHLRFHIVPDPLSGMFWLVSNQATDSMARIELLGPDTPGLGNNERHRLVLHFSCNLVDWCFAGIIATTPSLRYTRCYPSAVIDGEDLVVTARSADQHSASSRDTNLITLHRVPNFRNLCYL